MKITELFENEESSPLVFVSSDDDTGNQAAFADFCNQYRGKFAKFYPDGYFAVTGISTDELDKGKWIANLDQGETSDDLLGFIEDVHEDYLSHDGTEGPAVTVRFKPKAIVEVDCFHEDRFEHETFARKVSHGDLHYSQIQKIEVFEHPNDYHMTSFFNKLKDE